MTRIQIPARAIACCYRDAAGGLEVLVVRSRSGRWTLPKGHVETAELPVEAAAREAWEEAGVEGDIDPVPLTWVRIPARRGHISVGRSRTPVYALHVRRMHVPQEAWRAPSWRTVRDGAARRAVRRGWPFHWRSRSILALQRRLGR